MLVQMLGSRYPQGDKLQTRKMVCRLIKTPRYSRSYFEVIKAASQYVHLRMSKIMHSTHYKVLYQECVF